MWENQARVLKRLKRPKRNGLTQTITKIVTKHLELNFAHTVKAIIKNWGTVLITCVVMEALVTLAVRVLVAVNMRKRPSPTQRHKHTNCRHTVSSEPHGSPVFVVEIQHRILMPLGLTYSDDTALNWEVVQVL